MDPIRFHREANRRVQFSKRGSQEVIVMLGRIFALITSGVVTLGGVNPISSGQPTFNQAGTQAIKKEPMLQGSFCKVDQFGPATPSTQEQLDRTEALPQIYKLLSKVAPAASIRKEDFFEFTCKNLRGRAVIIPLFTKSGQPESRQFGVTLLNGNASLTFLISSPAPGTISIHDSSGEGMEMKFDTEGIKEASAKASPKSIWTCIAESLKKRADIQDAPGWSAEAMFCLIGKSVATCSVLMADVAGLLLGVWSDCRG